MNKKLFNAFFGICLFANLAMANESSGLFIGVDTAWIYTQVKSDLKHKSTNNKANFKADVSGNMPVFGLKLGYRLNQTHRIYATYNYSDEFSDLIRISGFEIEGDFTSYKFLLAYDFTPKLFEKTRGVLGVYSGYTKTHIDLKTSYLSLSRKFDGFSYGFKIGTMYELTQYNEIELTFKAEQISYNSRNFQQNIIGSNFYNPTQRNYGVYLGYNYKF